MKFAGAKAEKHLEGANLTYVFGAVEQKQFLELKTEQMGRTF